MKTLFIALEKSFPLNTAGNIAVIKHDLINDLSYELGAELSFLAKGTSIADKASIITDYVNERPDEIEEFKKTIITPLQHALLSSEVPEEMTIKFPVAYIDWLSYNTQFSEIGKNLRIEDGSITVSPKDIFEEYFNNKLISEISNLLKSENDIKKFTIVNFDNSNSQLVKQIGGIDSNLQYEDYHGSWVQCEIGYAYCSGTGVAKDESESIPYYILAAEKGNGIAANWLGWCYQKGIGVSIDNDKAFKFYLRAAELGDSNGKANVAFCFDTGIGVAPDCVKAVEYYIPAAETGVAYAQNNLANIYYDGRLGSPNYEEAFKWYKRNSEFTDRTFSQYRTGMMLLEGLGTEKNSELALNYFLKSANGNYRLAYYQCGKLIEQGNGDYTHRNIEAIKYYKNYLDFKEDSMAKDSDEILKIKIEVSEAIVRLSDKIEEKQFYGWDLLENIVISDNVTEIGDNAFSLCGYLENVVIPTSVTKIGKEAFQRCRRLKSIIIPDSVIEIGEGCFMGCSNLTTIKLPNNLKKIGNKLFSDCSSLGSFDAPERVSEIGDSAFRGCTSLKKITLSESITIIGEYAFSGCVNLHEINMPESLEHIYSFAFEECESIESMILPSKIIKLENHLFGRCINLKKVILPSKLSFIGWKVFFGCSSLEAIDIPESVYCIDSAAFMNCISLKHFNVPKNIVYLGGEVFSGCKSLKTITFPEVITNNWFNLDFPDREDYTKDENDFNEFALCRFRFYEDLFKNCSSLEEIIVPVYVYGIDKGVFDGCSSLKKVDFKYLDIPKDERGNNLKSLKRDISQELSLSKEYKDMSYLYTLNLHQIHTPLFKDCISIKEILLPSSCEEIRQTLFVNCSSLEVVKFPRALIWTRDFYIWENCANINTIILTDWDFSEIRNRLKYKEFFIKNFDLLKSVERIVVSSIVNASDFFGYYCNKIEVTPVARHSVLSVSNDTIKKTSSETIEVKKEKSNEGNSKTIKKDISQKDSTQEKRTSVNTEKNSRSKIYIQKDVKTSTSRQTTTKKTSKKEESEERTLENVGKKVSGFFSKLFK